VIIVPPFRSKFSKLNTTSESGSTYGIYVEGICSTGAVIPDSGIGVID
jgi:hypothetical protein